VGQSRINYRGHFQTDQLPRIEVLAERRMTNERGRLLGGGLVNGCVWLTLNGGVFLLVRDRCLHLFRRGAVANLSGMAFPARYQFSHRERPPFTRTDSNGANASKRKGTTNLFRVGKGASTSLFKTGHWQIQTRPLTRKQASTRIDIRTKREHCHEPANWKCSMPQSAEPNPQSEADRLDAAANQAIAACGGNARDAVKALIVANEFLETEVCELMQAVSHAYARGRFKTYTG
jgi:hypothetical protein